MCINIMLINSNKNKNWTPPWCREYGKCMLHEKNNSIQFYRELLYSTVPLHTPALKRYVASLPSTGRDRVVGTTTFYHCVLVTH